MPQRYYSTLNRFTHSCRELTVRRHRLNWFRCPNHSRQAQRIVNLSTTTPSRATTTASSLPEVR